MIRFLLLTISLICFVSVSIAQQKKNNFSEKTDSTSVQHAFKTGQFNGQIKYFFMLTDNEKELTDYYANAIGAGLRFETAPFHNFQFAIGSFHHFNIGSSDLSKPDSITGQFNRYEAALFDVNDLYNKKDLNRLEELFIKYNFRRSNIKAGRQFIKTALINLQDGRMRPTAVEAVWAEINEFKNLKIELGTIWRISPRGTNGWYSPGETMGMYPTGINPDGTKSEYQNNIKSNTVSLLGVTKALGKNIKIQFWNMYADNVFNTAMIQAEVLFPLKNKQTVFIAAQALRQDAIHDGGNADQTKTYLAKGKKSFSFGARVGIKNAKWETSINYNRITKDGRFLNPREWGIEPFFTFLPRERNEGAGDVHAVMGKFNYKFDKARLNTSLAAGYYHLPDVKNYALNKYNMPTYIQLNADAKYTFSKMFEGLEAGFLLVAKINNGETYQNKKSIFNKVNMLQYNFILNYHF